jgi:hypothetical protein
MKGPGRATEGDRREYCAPVFEGMAKIDVFDLPGFGVLLISD